MTNDVGGVKMRAYSSVFAVLAVCTACLTVVLPVTAAPTRQHTGGSFTRLLSFVPAPATPDELIGVWVTYADPGAVRRLHGYTYSHVDEIPEQAPADAAELNPEQLRARHWRWDTQTMDPPRAAGLENASRWREPFGYDYFSIERALGRGQPPDDYGVIELTTDTATIGEKLIAAGYEQEPAPNGFAGTLYRKLGDYEQRFSDPTSRIALSNMNRLVLGNGVLVAGRATDVVSDAVAAHVGAMPSAMTVPQIAQVVGAVEDENLVPGTTLISSSVLGLKWAPTGGVPADMLIQAQSPEEARRAVEASMQAANAVPLLPPYILFALAYHRGADQSERFQTITLLYPDESVARAAGAALTARIAAYRGVGDGKPILGEEVAEQLEPIVRAGEGGATVTARLRLSPDHPNRFYQRLYRRDLGFLAPGGS